MPVKHFQSKPRSEQPDKAAEVAPLPFTLPGNARVLVATPPKRAVWQRAVLAMRPNVPNDRATAAMVDYLQGTLADPQDAAHLQDRLLYGGDKLDLDDLFPVVTWLAEDWTRQTRDAEYRAAQQAAYAEFLAELQAPPAPEAPELAEPSVQTRTDGEGGAVIDGEVAAETPAPRTPAKRAPRKAAAATRR